VEFISALEPRLIKGGEDWELERGGARQETETGEFWRVRHARRRAGNSEHELFSANPVKIYEKSLRPVARAMIAQVNYEGWKNERELTPANPVKSHKES
jgi:hypothetical protein